MMATREQRLAREIAKTNVWRYTKALRILRKVREELHDDYVNSLFHADEHVALAALCKRVAERETPSG